MGLVVGTIAVVAATYHQLVARAVPTELWSPPASRSSLSRSRTPDHERIRTSPIGGFGVITKDPDQRTASGVGIGSTRGDVKAGVPGVSGANEFGVSHCYVGEFVPGETVTDFNLKKKKHKPARVNRVGVGIVLD